MTGAAVLLALLGATTFWLTLAIAHCKPHKAPQSDEHPDPGTI